jgi:hypothetical protein
MTSQNTSPRPQNVSSRKSLSRGSGPQRKKMTNAAEIVDNPILISIEKTLNVRKGKISADLFICMMDY